VTWTISLSTAIEQLNGISAVIYGENAGVVWVVGNSNVVYLSEDYGTSWTAITGPSAGDNLMTVVVTMDGTVFVGNDAGEIWGSYDEGISWNLLPAQGVTATGIDDIAAWGDSNIWVALNTADGGRVLRSTDGGASFRLWTLNIPDNSGLNTLAVVDPNIIFVGGEPHGGVAFVTRTKSQLLGDLTQVMA
jgi:photosystem II stability/assembly factor-like uncharacterized protein